MTGQRENSRSLPVSSSQANFEMEHGPSIELDYACLTPHPLPPPPPSLPAPAVRRRQKDPLSFFLVLHRALAGFTTFLPTCSAAMLAWAVIAFAAGMSVKILFYFFVDEWRMFFRLSGFLVLLFWESSLHCAMLAALGVMALETLDGFSVTSSRIYSHLLYGPLLFLNFLLYSLLVLLGMIFLVLPGLYLAHALIFSFPLVAERRLYPWVALLHSFHGFNRRPWRLGSLVAFSVLLGAGGFVPYFLAFFLSKGLDWRFLALLALPLLTTPLALLVFAETYGRMKNQECWE